MIVLVWQYQIVNMTILIFSPIKFPIDHEGFVIPPCLACSQKSLCGASFIYFYLINTFRFGSVRFFKKTLMLLFSKDAFI